MLGAYLLAHRLPSSTIGNSILLRTEDRFDRQDGLGLDRVVGLHGDAEVMRSAHAFMHRHSDAEGAGLTRLYCRRTDDGLRRSAALDNVYGRLLNDADGFGSHVAVGKTLLDRLVEGNLAEVYFRFIEDQARPGHFLRWGVALGRGGSGLS